MLFHNCDTLSTYTHMRLQTQMFAGVNSHIFVLEMSPSRCDQARQHLDSNNI